MFKEVQDSSKPQDGFQLARTDSFETVLEQVDIIRRQRGRLDDDAILAVAEMTGVSPEQVRVAIKVQSDTDKSGLLERARSSYLTLSPESRLYALSAVLALVMGVAHDLEIATANNSIRFLNIVKLGAVDQIFQIIQMAVVCGLLYSVCLARNRKQAAFAGGIFGGLSFVVGEIIAAVFTGMETPSGFLLPVVMALGAGIGVFAQEAVARNRNKFGLKDPVEERKQLLAQLVEIQEKLRGGEQEVSFLSVDIVGSTKMKELADHLSVEYTFTEYHQFVERVVHRFGGRVHSTAGDGVTAAFETPMQAFGAGRALQAGIIELNTFKNRIGHPIILRCGVHAGRVVAPDKHDITSLNFAQVIDLAAHIQKVCPPGGVAISEAAANRVPGGPGAIGGSPFANNEISGYIWVPRQLAVSAE